MEIYKVLLDVMDSQGLSIPDIARASGLADSTVRSIINRRSKSVALDVAARLSKGLHLTLEQLNDGLDLQIPMKSKSLPILKQADLTLEESQLVQGYRSLDPRGQSTVRATLEHELQVSRRGEADKISHGA